MSFLNRCVCVFFLFLASVGIVSASPVTPTGFFYPVGDDNLQVSGCGRWLTKPAPDGCYPSSGVYHIGVDIMADKGIPVRAIADGEVLEPSISGWSNDGTSDNIALLVRHHSVEEGDVVSLYGHVLRAGAKVKGDSVKAGEIIAYVGHWVGGDHIHFGMLTPGLSYPPASGYGRWSYAKYGVSENGYFDNGFIDPIYFIAHHGAKNSASCAEQRNNLPATITRDHACFAELCPGVALDSRCDPSDTEMYTVCVYEGSSLCAVPSSVWSATGHGASTSGNPEGAGGDSNPPPTTSLPNLQIEEITVHTVPEDGDNTRLTEETSLMNVEESYQVNVWPVSKEEHCQNGNTTGNEDFEVKTDTFYKVAMSEDEGEWTLLKRSETHCKYMDEDNSKKEMISFTVPIEASGKRVYFKSKVDAPGNIFESNEDDNWSDVEWYPVNGSCDLVIASGNLTKGRITLNQGEPYGFGGTLLNLGPDSCPSDTRLSYYYKKPGDTDWRYADGDDTPAFKLLPNQTNEEWMTEDTLVADILGTYQGRICADTNNANRETSEVNNCFDFSYTVIAQVWKPDFVVSSLWIAEGTTIKSGTRVHPHCIVKNIGNAKPTKDMRLAYYINSNQYRDDDNVEANEMCVGCEQHEQVNNNNIKLGDRGIRSYMCCVDNKGAVDELNESNNCATIYFTVVK
jgi:hypothetical protein